MAAKTKKTTDSKDKKPAKKAVTVKKKTTKKTTKKAVKETKTSKLVVSEHMLVPKHEILNDKDKQKLFEEFGITLKNLPKLLVSDAAIKTLNPKEGDVIKITRKSYTAGETVFYRGVVND